VVAERSRLVNRVAQAQERQVAFAELATTMATESRLKTLPDIDRLKSLCQSLAMLDAIMSPDWEYRYYSFDSKWDLNEMMASMRNGQGDDFFILFNDNGAIIKGFDHESPMSPYANDPKRVWPGVLDEVPDVLMTCSLIRRKIGPASSENLVLIHKAEFSIRTRAKVLNYAQTQPLIVIFI
jgi:hypothetical protein